MSLFRTVDPAVEPVTIADAKASLRIGHDSEDALIAGLIRAARQEVEAQTGTALIDQHWRLALDRWPQSGIVELRRFPVREITAVTVYDGDGGASVADPRQYQLDSQSRPARLWFSEPPWPGLMLNGIEIDFRAGFGESGPDVPDILKRALILLVGHWFELRGAFTAADQPASYPPGFDRLIAGYRARRL